MRRPIRVPRIDAPSVSRLLGRCGGIPLLALVVASFLALTMEAVAVVPPASVVPPAIGEAIVDSHGIVRTIRARPGRPEQRAFDLGPFGTATAIETSRTPGVWEGQVFAEGRPVGFAFDIETTVGRVVMVDRGDGRPVQALPLGDGTSRLVRRDEAMPGCFGAEPVPTSAILEGAGGFGDEGGVAGLCDDGTRLDVLVKWTPTAETEAGGATAVRAIAEASVAASNHVYAMSGVSLRMRAVGYGATEAYSGDAGSSVLSQLRIQGDGFLDSVHAERDSLGADLVVLVTGDNPNYCGVAYMLGVNAPTYGFAVSVWDCSLGNLTFPHEVGHNQGCCHAPGDGGGCTSGGVFSYSVGHRWTGTSGQQWRSVMAYSPGLRWPRFSSPLVTHDGVATGLSTADNARTLNETDVVMANFRCEVVADDGSEDHVRSPRLAVPTDGQSIAYVVPTVPEADAGTTVAFTIAAVADHSAAAESLSLRIDGTNLGVVLNGTNADCTIAARTTMMPASTFNAAIGDGTDVVFTITSSGAVNAVCTGSEMSFVLRYVAAPSCLGDLNGDGLVDGVDLSMLLDAWGNTGGAADLDASGLVNGADLGIVLLSWGGCG